MNQMDDLKYVGNTTVFLCYEEYNGNRKENNLVRANHTTQKTGHAENQTKYLLIRANIVQDGKIRERGF